MIEERLSSKEMAGLEADYEKIANIGKLIRQREIEIEWPYHEFRDENVGGGRSSTTVFKAQRIAEAKEKDTYLQRLYRLRKIKNDLLLDMTKQQKQIYELRWCTDDYYDWRMVGELLEPPLAQAQMYRKREKILELLAKKEGILKNDNI
ncbi:transcriptional regulator [Liquorilactobacillus nagelii]|uniref:transcriptional regulator n=1 Tax=Liquorilactobacillus nagelii TaxID=82688 RepID=UPI00242F9920|nr:transcriptional regulator [Liquorilactobacillus nagelii]MCI1700008.1 RinA family protein [Liquorilactobacillus nagelii]